MLLTVDCGNSRCKLRLWSGREALDGVDLAVDGELAKAAAAWLARRPRCAGGALSAVAALEREEELVAALAPLIDGPLARAPDAGLANECRAPERTGRDRLYAARAALDLVGGACVVVDAGTTLTVDAARDGRFLGGAIAPGPALLGAALARGGARLLTFEARPGAPALGRDTSAALAAGVAVGFRGAARELVERVAEEADLGSAPAVLTGGARRFLLEPVAFTSARAVRVEPDLVHHGLLAAWERTRGRA